MKDIFQVAGREMGRLIRGKIYWFCMLIAPLISAVFFLSLMSGGLPTSLPVALVDMDNTSTSRSLARQLNAFEGAEIFHQFADFEDARKSMQRGEIYGIFLIPNNFSRDILTNKQPKISFYTNNAYLIAGSLMFKDMKTISTLASGAVVLEIGRAKGYSDAQIMAQVQPVVLDTRPIGNPWLNYSLYLNNLILPGILALLVMSVTVYSIGIEMKEKTVRSWFKTGNYSMFKCIMGKVLPQTVIFFISGLLIYLGLYVFQQFPINHLFSMVVALYLLIVASQALGVFMIGCLPTLRLGLSFACIWGMIAFSISGFSFPVNAMYPYIQSLSNLFPLRHYFLIYVDQALNGRDLFFSWPHYTALLAFLLLPLLILRNLKWSLKHMAYAP